jgi:hypothetical protein
VPTDNVFLIAAAAGFILLDVAATHYGMDRRALPDVQPRRRP